MNVRQALPGDFEGLREVARGASGASGTTAPRRIEATWWYFGRVARLPLVVFDDFARAFAIARASIEQR
jgi:hypothetical protein